MSSVVAEIAGADRGGSYPNIVLTVLDIGMAAILVSRDLRLRRRVNAENLRTLGLPEALLR